MKLFVTDRQSYTITHREFTDQGYLRVPGRVARTGVQDYLASELGLTDRDPKDIVRVYRPAEEVFAPDSLSTYENADVTDDHPSQMVDSRSYKDVAVGYVTGPGRVDDTYVVADLLIKDQAAIDAIQSGKVELSAGYENEYHREPGVTEDGQEYEFVQRNIRINHVALVDRARAGNQAKLFDREVKTMAHVTLDGKSVTVDNEATAQLIQHAFDAKEGKFKEMEDKYNTAKKDMEDASEEMEKLKAAKDAAEEEAEKMKEKSSDAAISERIKEVAEVRDQATKMIGEDFTCDSIVPLEIKRAAMEKLHPTRDWAKQTEAYITAAWDMEAERTEADRTTDAARRSHMNLSDDVKNLYTGDGGVMKGDAEYQKFLTGGTA